MMRMRNGDRERIGGIGAFMGLCGFWVRGLAKRGVGRMET